MAADSLLSRRDILATGGLALLAAGVPAWPTFAGASSLEEALAKLFGQRGLAEGRVKLDVPPIAENGLVVPVTIEVESPMTETDYVKSLHLFAEANPVPHVGSYRFTPANGKAAISTRIRLAQTQTVTAIAEMSDGALHSAKTLVKVTIGGCG